MNKSSASKALVWGGLIAGALDLAAACVVSWLRAGLRPVRIMQSISSGLMGSTAYSGGTKTADARRRAALFDRYHLDRRFLCGESEAAVSA